MGYKNTINTINTMKNNFLYTGSDRYEWRAVYKEFEKDGITYIKSVPFDDELDKKPLAIGLYENTDNGMQQHIIDVEIDSLKEVIDIVDSLE